MAILTDIRQSIWDDLEASDAFWLPLKRKFKLEGRTPLLSDTNGRPKVTMGDLPCVIVEPVIVTPEWDTNQTQLVQYVNNVKLFTRDLDVTKGELLWQAAVVQMLSEASLIAAATNFNPDIGSLTQTDTRIEGGWSKLWLLQITCNYRWNPRT